MFIIELIEGNIFKSGADVILHQVNCQGVMGSGIAKQVKELYPHVYNCYKTKCNEYKYNTSLLLGSIQVCYKESYAVDVVEDSQAIVNMFAQDRYGHSSKRHTDYDALRKCLKAVNKHFAGKSVAIPYLMSCCRGGGDWGVVSSMIGDELHNCNVSLYRFG